MNPNRLSLFVLVVLMAGCSPRNTAKPRQDVYDRLDWQRSQYNVALDSRDFTQQARVEVTICREAIQNFDMLMRDAMEEPDGRRRYLATFALGFSKRGEAGGVLVARLDDADPQIRVAGAVALGQLGVANPPIEKVKKMLDDPDVSVRVGALYALKLLLATGQEGGLTRKLVEMLEDGSPEVRNEIVQLMGRVRKPELLEPLFRKGLKDPHMLVRLNSAMSIGSFGAAGVSAIPSLIEALKDIEAKVVESSHWALRKVTGKDLDRSYFAWREWYEEEQRKNPKPSPEK